MPNKPSRVIWLIAALVSAASFRCALQPPPAHPAPASLARYRQAIDWQRAGEESVQILSRYLQLDTSNPPGNETRAARFLAEILQKEGIATEIVGEESGRGSLIARLKGNGQQPPLCLVSHTDVVPGGEDWPPDRGPFSGAIADGYVWGRGALDMKGMGVLELMTMVWLKRLGVPLTREVVLLAVADEEVDNRGMSEIGKRWSEIGCSEAVNEGGAGIKDMLFEGQTVFAISVAEKGLLWVKLIVHGEAGHGSTPIPGRAPARLLEALGRILTVEPEPRLHPAFEELFRAVGEQHGGLTGSLLRRPLLARRLTRGRLLEKPPSRAAITNTVQLTGLGGVGTSPNVIPAEAWAQFDCRLLPGTNPDQFLDDLKARVGDLPGLEWQVLHSAVANESPIDDPFYAALARQAVAGRSDAVAGPVLSVGYTDSLLMRRWGVRAYGLVPFEVPQEELITMHGKGERVSLENVHRGLRILFSAVVDVAAAP